MPLLDIRDLTIELNTPYGRVNATDRVSLRIYSCERVGHQLNGRFSGRWTKRDAHY